MTTLKPEVLILSAAPSDDLTCSSISSRYSRKCLSEGMPGNVVPFRPFAYWAKEGALVKDLAQVQPSCNLVDIGAQLHPCRLSKTNGVCPLCARQC